MTGTLNRQLWLQTYDTNKGVQYSIRVCTEHTIMGRLQLWANVSTISYCESNYHIGIHWKYGTVLRNKNIFINQGNGLAYSKFLISPKDHPFYIACLALWWKMSLSESSCLYVRTKQREKHIRVFTIVVECREEIFPSLLLSCFSFTDERHHWLTGFTNDYPFHWHLPQATEPWWLSIQYGLNIISSVSVCTLKQVLSSCWYHH